MLWKPTVLTLACAGCSFLASAARAEPGSASTAAEAGAARLTAGPSWEGQLTSALALTLTGTLQAASGGPQFVYGAGPQGFGYYPVPAQPASAPVALARASAPRATAGAAPRRHREFGSGRSVRLAKPWLSSS